MADRPHVCVFCGSSPGARPSYADAARRVGVSLARSGIGLVYGGGRVGLMGTLADATLGAGGRVVGVIPLPLSRPELAHDGLTELHIVDTMHERKALMARRSDAFLMLPGGVGTFEEFFEILTWGVLGLHRKPIGLLDVDGYYGPLRAMLDHAVAEGFAARAHLEPIFASTDPDAVVSGLLARIDSSGPAPRSFLREDQT